MKAQNSVLPFYNSIEVGNVKEKKMNEIII